MLKPLKMKSPSICSSALLLILCLLFGRIYTPLFHMVLKHTNKLLTKTNQSRIDLIDDILVNLVF